MPQDLQEYTREFIKEAGFFGSVAKSLFSKGKSLGYGAAKYTGNAIFGAKGMVGSGTRKALKGLATSPRKTIKEGFKNMSGTEKVFMGTMGSEGIRDSAGELRPGETRLGRIGSNVGTMAGYLATPIKSVGLLGNMFAGDLVGGTVGQQAGRLASKGVGVASRAMKPAKSMESKFRKTASSSLYDRLKEKSLS